MLELGCLFGALGAGVLADRLSRRAGIMFACGALLFCLQSVLCCVDSLRKLSSALGLLSNAELHRSRF